MEGKRMSSRVSGLNSRDDGCITGRSESWGQIDMEKDVVSKVRH